MVTSSAPSFFACTPASIAVMPPPITTTRRPTGSAGEVLGLAELGDEVDRRAHDRAAASAVGERAHAAEADAEEDGVEVGEELGERHVAAEARALAQR